MRDRIIKKILLLAPQSRVFKALSDHNEFGKWFGAKLKGPFEEGKNVIGNITYPGYEHLIFEAKIVAIQPESYFAMRWHPGIPKEGEDLSKAPTTLVEFQLKTIGKHTQLTLIESGFDQLPEERQKEAYETNEDGWEKQMTNIKSFVEGKK